MAKRLSPRGRRIVRAAFAAIDRMAVTTIVHTFAKRQFGEPITLIRLSTEKRMWLLRAGSTVHRVTWKQVGQWAAESQAKGKAREL